MATSLSPAPSPALEGVDAVILTHGGHEAGLTETVDYGGVKSILNAVKGRTVRIVLMTAVGTTSRHQSFNISTGVHDWKRRSEWLLRASGQPYVIVRPGWFDYNDDDQHQLVFLQGDTRQHGSPADGVIAREQIARVLIAAVTDEKATGKNLRAGRGEGPRAGEPDTTVRGTRPRRRWQHLRGPRQRQLPPV